MNLIQAAEGGIVELLFESAVGCEYISEKDRSDDIL